MPVDAGAPRQPGLTLHQLGDPTITPNSLGDGCERLQLRSRNGMNSAQALRQSRMIAG